MLYYPQLATGALAQYPLRRTTLARTVVNHLHDGSTLKLADPDAHGYRWELRYTGLSDAERLSLEDFFATTEGALRSFLFLDPDGNLLRWSEDPEQTVWRNDGQVSVAITDSFENAARILRVTNGGQIEQGLEQAVTAPGWFHYCFGARVRSTEPARVRMTLSNADGAMESSWTAAEPWSLVWCSGVIPGEASEIRCGMSFEAGSTVEVCGLQLQAQPMPGAYKRTTAANGVFPGARFADDRLEFRADGVDDHSTVIRVVGADSVG